MVGGQAARIHRPNAPVVGPAAIMVQPMAGSAAVHIAPVQSSLTSWRRLKRINTDDGMRMAKFINSRRRAFCGSLSAPRCADASAAAAARTPVGVINTNAEAI